MLDAPRYWRCSKDYGRIVLVHTDHSIGPLEAGEKVINLVYCQQDHFDYFSCNELPDSLLTIHHQREAQMTCPTILSATGNFSYSINVLPEER